MEMLHLGKARIFRVENPLTMQGLWYDSEGNFNPMVTTLSHGQCRDLPMDFNPTFLLGGLRWYSACDSLSDMRNWFSHQDLVELAQRGYDLYEFEVQRYRTVTGHAAFARQDVLSSRILDLDVLRKTDDHTDLHSGDAA